MRIHWRRILLWLSEARHVLTMDQYWIPSQLYEKIGTRIPLAT